MQIQILYGMLLAVFMLISCENANQRYIVLLQEGTTEEQVEKLIQQIEQYSASSRDEMLVEFDNSLVPLVFANFNKDTANMVISLLLPK